MVSDELETSKQKVGKMRKELNEARHLIVDSNEHMLRDEANAEREKQQAKKLKLKAKTKNRRNSVTGRKQILSPEKEAVKAVATGIIIS